MNILAQSYKILCLLYLLLFNNRFVFAFIYAHAYVLGICVDPAEPYNWVSNTPELEFQKLVSSLAWVLRTKAETSGGTGYALNYLTTPCFSWGQAHCVSKVTLEHMILLYLPAEDEGGKQ